MMSEWKFRTSERFATVRNRKPTCPERSCSVQ
nr:MAG TPA: hypothetical protein [Caudoviricetes sp.]